MVFCFINILRKYNFIKLFTEILGRIVILSLQPPTYEIFLMCSGILLLSSGRVMYSGSRIGFVEHFSNVGYPCPMYKNPSDYYCKSIFKVNIFFIIISYSIFLFLLQWI